MYAENTDGNWGTTLPLVFSGARDNGPHTYLIKSNRMHNETMEAYGNCSLVGSHVEDNALFQALFLFKIKNCECARLRL